MNMTEPFQLGGGLWHLASSLDSHVRDCKQERKEATQRVLAYLLILFQFGVMAVTCLRRAFVNGVVLE